MTYEDLRDFEPRTWDAIRWNVQDKLKILLGDNYRDIVSQEATEHDVIPESHFTIVNSMYTLPTWPKFGEFETLEEARGEAAAYAMGLLQREYDLEVDMYCDSDAWEHYRE